MSEDTEPQNSTVEDSDRYTVNLHPSASLNANMLEHVRRFIDMEQPRWYRWSRDGVNYDFHDEIAEPPATQSHAMDLARYIETTSSSFGIQLSKDLRDGILEAVSSYEGDQLSKVNQLLMEYMSSPDTLAETIQDITKNSALDLLKQKLDGFRVSTVDPMRLRRDRDTTLATIRSRQSQLSEYYTRLQEILSQIKLLEFNPSAFASKWWKALESAIKMPQFTFSGWEELSIANGPGVSLYFITEPIKCGHTIRAKGWNHWVDLGRFLVIIHLGPQNWNIEVKEFSGNVNSDGYIHPHISSSGEVCWGTASEPLNEAYNRSDLSNMLAILYSTMTQYNHANPFICLFDFEHKTTAIKDLSHTDITKTDYYQEELWTESTTLADRNWGTDKLDVTNFIEVRRNILRIKNQGLDCPEFLNQYDISDYEVTDELKNAYHVFARPYISCETTVPNQAILRDEDIIIDNLNDRYVGVAIPENTESNPKSVRSDARRRIMRFRSDASNNEMISNGVNSSKHVYSKESGFISTNSYDYVAQEEVNRRGIDSTTIDQWKKIINDGVASGNLALGTLVIISRFHTGHQIVEKGVPVYGVVTRTIGSSSYELFIPSIAHKFYRINKVDVIGVPYEN